tara:strand:- start:281 stop:1024 length:744 start_codon:yes stop_codon:yes gene_type:complete
MIVANFKANGDSSFILKWHKEFIQEASKNIFSSVGVAPSHIHFYKLNKLFRETGVRLGMQNIDEEGGARTGAISAKMASEIGCSFLILGHSERRIFFNENNNDIKNKIQLSINNGIAPILCIGETLEENESGKTKDVLKNQLHESLYNFELNKDFIVAYEPIWAIGSGNTPDEKDINAIHEFIKDVVQSSSVNNITPKVLYGGSVNDNNAEILFSEDNIDGALVGGASLDAKVFAKIVNTFERLNKQ